MEPYKLQFPDLTAIDAERCFSLLYSGKSPQYLNAVNHRNEDGYVFWDKLQYKTIPEGLSASEFWFQIKQIRTITARPTYIKSESGENFKWIRLGYTDEWLHHVDMILGGQFFEHYTPTLTPQYKRQLLTKSIIEEAIASSQLEGAAVTTPMAKKMLLERKPPRTKDERMIVNNYKTMQALNEEYKNKPLSSEILLELHRLITKDTLASDAQGRYRKDSDDITVNDGIRYIYHVPPKEEFLKGEIDRLIKFANDEDDNKFVHPIIKAIFIHFWIGYLHPFYDGNGRMARTLFYWYLLKKGYFAIQYLPISLVLKRSAKDYGMSYVYTEQDGLDLTYFYDFQMRKIQRALEDFKEHIARKTKENTHLENVISNKYAINARQAQVIHTLILGGEDSYVTPSSHETIHNVSRPTAIADLKGLEKKGLLSAKKEGWYVKYLGSTKLRDLS